MLRFVCPQCSQAVRVDESAAGKKGRCPLCGAVVDVPLASQAPDPVAALQVSSSARGPAGAPSASAPPHRSGLDEGDLRPPEDRLLEKTDILPAMSSDSSAGRSINRIEPRREPASTAEQSAPARPAANQHAQLGVLTKIGLIVAAGMAAVTFALLATGVI